MNYLIAALLELGLGDPHVFEEGQARQNAASLPADGVATGGCQHPGLHFLVDLVPELPDYFVWEALDHGVASRKNDLVVECFPEGQVHFVEAVEQQLRDG